MLMPITTQALSTGLPYKSLDFDGSSDYLSISNANFGTYDANKFAIALSFYRNSDGTFDALYSKFGTSGSRDFFVLLGTTSKLQIQVNHSGTTLDGYITTTATFGVATWYAMLFHWDFNNATSGDRMRLWINNAEVTAFDHDTAPTTGHTITSQQVEIGNTVASGRYFDGLIYQPTFFSGVLPSPADVFNGSSGKLKDLSGLSGVHSHVGGIVSPTSDTILSADWTNQGTVTTSSTTP